MTRQTVLITGANKSIGFETARQLGVLGYRIWLGSRDVGRGQAATDQLRAEGHDVRHIDIDVTNDASVSAASQRVATEDGQLDILINNAGIPGMSVPPSQQPVDNVREVYETNVFGPIRVTRAFLPLLKAANGAKIIMVSSGLGSLTWRSDPGNMHHGVNFMGYNSSKTALNAVTLAFAQELAPDRIAVNATDPGYTATDFNHHSGYRTVEQAAAGIVWLAERNDPEQTGGYFFEQDRVPW
ncbi:SDR family oxidoreductase [Asticcacaulis benevestitus]|uniref:Serralysin n=1 Tax=Asticcacaulis benevestitus DSM 16100 = ATCC BAA-896 TaxID=1121022 RepID=V4PIG1_9CAUL|nr:SDR family oxidoreductase [Asticcacaulis benevestitus]ESQ87014.1 hypothetical protein ABENE_17445 [Asticcacaulis benevestitus DSM 16100 = ATCC BAA-896]